MHADGGADSRTFDKLVMCSGLYSAHKKFVPTAAGRGEFEGDVLHTHDYRENTQVPRAPGGGASTAFNSSWLDGVLVVTVKVDRQPMI